MYLWYLTTCGGGQSSIAVKHRSCSPQPNTHGECCQLAWNPAGVCSCSLAGSDRSHFHPAPVHSEPTRSTLTRRISSPRPACCRAPTLPCPIRAQLLAQGRNRTSVVLACADVARAQQQYSPAHCPLLRLTAGWMHAVGGRSRRGAGRVAQWRALTSCVFPPTNPSSHPAELPPLLARFRPWHRGVVGGRRGCSGSELTAHSARNPALQKTFAKR